MTTPLLALLLAGSTLHAAPPDSRAAAACIDVEVNGQRIPDYDCLGRLLAAPTDPQGQPSPPSAAEELARRPPTRMGLVTPEATRQRMGNSFGKSTMPQRPGTTPPALPPTVRRP